MSATSELADAYWAHRQAGDALTALWKGELEHLESWEDLSPDGKQEYRSALSRFADRADSATPETPAERDTLETIAFTARASIAQLAWRDELELVNHEIGLHSLLNTFLPRYALLTPDHGDRYFRKLDALATMIDQLDDRLVEAATIGRVPNVHTVQSTIAAIDAHLALPLNKDPLASQPAPRELGPSNAIAWRTRLLDRLETSVRPALGRFRATLATHTLPVARPDAKPGLAHLEGGAEVYRRLAWSHTTLDLGPERIHEIGMEQVARLEDEYRRIGSPVLGTGDVSEIYRRLREDPSLHYSDAGRLVADATAALAKAAEAMGDWFGVLPQAPCVAHSIETGALAFYSKPAKDGSKPGTFFFNTRNPAMWGTFQLEAVTYHEGIPGHHLQIALAQENENLHPVHAEIYIAAYSEGWGLYTERLADEMGLYTSEFDRLGMLSADSMRSCRLVVDTGIHALGWSRDEAIAYMLDHSPMSLDQVAGEVDRYIGDPGQALGYMIGRLEIERIRTTAEARLGDAFDIKDFHDLVLGGGSVPLTTLARKVESWQGRIPA